MSSTELADAVHTMACQVKQLDLGSNDDEEHQRSDSSPDDVMSKLPPHILENIFCHIPFRHLMTNIALVSHRWLDIITNPSYLKWKTMYHELKLKNCEFVQRQMREFISDQAFDQVDGFRRIILYTASFRKTTPEMLKCLESHPKAEMAMTLLDDQRFADAQVDGVISGWAFLAALLLLSDSVEDVTWALNALLNPPSPCEPWVVIDAFYLLASVLYYLHKELRLCGPGLHYRMYCALHIFENNTGFVGEMQCGQNDASQSGDPSFMLTSEQKQVVHHILQPNDLVKVIGYAGCGKTTTLIHFAKTRPHMTFLYLSNKPVPTECCRLFPKNVTCETFDNLAYSALKLWRHPFKIASKSLIPYDLLNEFDIPDDRKLATAAAVCHTINIYMSSSDEHVELCHVPLWSYSQKGGWSQLDDEESQSYIPLAQRIVDDIIDLENHQWTMSQDYYMKKYQLSKPIITGYDCILMDDAEDCSAAMLDIVRRQKCPRIVAGDPHQYLNELDGAVAPMDFIKNAKTFYLKQSFHLGSEIAYLVSTVLDTANAERNVTLIGSNGNGSVVGKLCGEQKTVIGRSNFDIFEQAVQYFCRRRRTKGNPLTGAFVGGLSSYGFDQLSSIATLFRNSLSTPGGTDDIRDPFICKFESFAILNDYANISHDRPLMDNIKIVTTYSDKAVDYYDILQRTCNHPIQTADVVFATADNVKGWEFNAVQLSGKFLKLFKFDIDQRLLLPLECMDTREVNLLCMALTCAKKQFRLNFSLCHTFVAAGELFEYPRLFNGVPSDTLCCDCSRPVNPEMPLTLHRRPMLGTRDESIGFMCARCIHVSTFAHLPGLIYLDSVKIKNKQRTMYGMLLTGKKSYPRLEYAVHPSSDSDIEGSNDEYDDEEDSYSSDNDQYYHIHTEDEDLMCTI